MEVGIKYKPSKEEVTSLSPEFQQFWGEKFATKTDKALAVIVGTAGYACRVDSCSWDPADGPTLSVFLVLTMASHRTRN